MRSVSSRCVDKYLVQADSYDKAVERLKTERPEYAVTGSYGKGREYYFENKTIEHVS